MKSLDVMSERSEMMRALAIIGDFVLLNMIMAVMYYLLKFNGIMLSDIPLSSYLTVANLCYIPCISTFKVILHYRIVRSEQIVSRICGAVTMHLAIFIAVMSLLHLGSMSDKLLWIFYPTFWIALIVWRLRLRHFVKARRRHGKNVRSVLLVGSGDNLNELEDIMGDLTYGFHVMAHFFKGASFIDPESVNYKAELDALKRWLQEHDVQEVYCSLPSVCQLDIMHLVRYCENNMIRFYSVPNVRNYLKRQLKMILLGDVPVLSIRNEPLQDPINRLVKRSFDLLCSSIFLLTIFPFLYIIVGIIIKITSPGPVFFKQKRTGEDGKDFYCYKFRSMKVNKDSDLVQATKNDPRKTKFGNFLRKSNLDEMPQFINVFLGNMSLVGPRPHMLKHTEEYSHLIDKYMVRHLVKPGITGWAQVTGFRGETKELEQMEGRVQRDLWYIENWTFLLDLRIMVMTVTNMFQGEKNAY